MSTRVYDFYLGKSVKQTQIVNVLPKNTFLNNINGDFNQDVFYYIDQLDDLTNNSSDFIPLNIQDFYAEGNKKSFDNFLSGKSFYSKDFKKLKLSIDPYNEEDNSGIYYVFCNKIPNYFDKKNNIYTNIYDLQISQLQPNHICSIQFFKQKDLMNIHNIRSDDFIFNNRDTQYNYILPVVVPKINNVIIEHNKFKYFVPNKFYPLTPIELGSEESLQLFSNSNIESDNICNYLQNTIISKFLFKSNNLNIIENYINDSMSKKMKLSNGLKYSNQFVIGCIKKLILSNQFHVLNQFIESNQKQPVLSLINRSHSVFNLNDKIHQVDTTDVFYSSLQTLDPSFILYLKDQFFPSLYNKLFSNQEYFNTSAVIFNKDNVIKSILDELSDELPHFILNWLKNNNCVLSGSYILKHILGSDWKSNDLDFYCIYNFQQLSSLEHFLFNNNIRYTEKSSNMSSYHLDDIKKIINFDLSLKNMQFELLPNGLPVFSNYYSENSTLKIQIMFIENYPSPWDFIQQNFDFDIVMNGFFFDNNKCDLLTSHNDFNNFHLATISDSYIRSMTNKSIRCYSNYRAAKTTERAIKYMKRGFVISNIDTFLQHVLDAFF